MKKILFSASILLGALLYGQDIPDLDSTIVTPNSLEVKLNAPYSLDELQERFIRINKTNKSIYGYRIQFYSGTREGANEAKAILLDLIPETDIYILYQQPYFKTKLGNFRTKLEAEKFQREMGDVCKGCFIVREKIDLPKLN